MSITMKVEQRPPVSQNLIKARKNMGWSQQKASDLLNVTLKAYQSWEEGRANPDINILPLLCSTFQITNLLAFIGNLNFDILNQEAVFEIYMAYPLEEKYMKASPDAQKIVDLALGIGHEGLPC
jgi:transcriptional regulator with XRE-family HTH domain